MKTPSPVPAPQVVDNEWISFPGGELEGPRPKVLCPSCREKMNQAANSHLAPSTSYPAPSTSHSGPHLAPRTPHPAPLCFACHRASVERDRALKAAGSIDTASEERFQTVLPLEPINQSRLARLRVERATARVTDHAGAGQYVDKRRQAQISARHALERIVIGLRARNATKPEFDRVTMTAIHAAELQLPEAWLPFVVSRHSGARG